MSFAVASRLGRERLIQTLRRLYLTHEGKPEQPIKFLINCRPDVDIERGFRLFADQISVSRLCGEDDMTSKQHELDLVIAARVQQLTWLNESIQSSI